MNLELELHKLKTMVLNESHISDLAKQKIADKILQIEKGAAINYTRCSTPLKHKSKSFFNVRNLADLKRLYPNKNSYNAKVCDGYIKYYVDEQLVITTALMV